MSDNTNKENTCPIRAGEIKIGMIILLDNHPCKIISIDISKTGKHGHSKAVFTGFDIFTNKKYTDMCPTSHNIYAPYVQTSVWTFVCMLDDQFCSLVNENGETREDLELPNFINPKGVNLEEEEIKVVVTKAMDTEKITSYVISPL